MNRAENRRILLIDDTPAIHEDFRKILVHNGSDPDLVEVEAALFGDPVGGAALRFELDDAFQGEEGLAKVTHALAQDRPYAMAFVDMRMPPGWDGVETVERLWEVDPRLQIVICTAYSDYSWEDLLERLEVGDRLLILKKPFDAIEVCQLASTLTAKWELDRRAQLKMASLEAEVRRRTAELQEANEALQRDIARREAAEREARDAYRKMADILEFLPDPTFVVDEQRRVIAWNRALEALTGVAKGELLGKGDHAYAVPFYGVPRPILIDLLDERSAAQEEGYRELTHDGATLAAEVTIALRDGKERILWSSAAPLYDMQGKKVGGIQTLRDITELRRSEQERSRLEGQLRHSTLMKSLLAKLSHDLRTPITPLFALIPMVQEKVSDPALTRMLDICHQSASQILGLTNKVLDLVRLSSESAPPDLVCLPLEAVVHNGVQRAAHLFARRGISCVNVIERQATVLADLDQLTLLLEHLLSNAARYAAENGTVRIRGTREGGVVTVAVEDDGVGIGEEHLELIFEEFYKADRARHDLNTQGLGLPLCKRIVLNHKGRIWAESAGPGRGTTIYFTLCSGDAEKEREEKA